jgi:hypothetical protein
MAGWYIKANIACLAASKPREGGASVLLILHLSQLSAFQRVSVSAFSSSSHFSL